MPAPLIGATVKAGTACKKAGQTSIYQGKKYTCIKSGKKLIWNKGVEVKKPSPVVTPTPTQTPTPTPSPLTIEREAWEFTYLKIWDELENAQNQGSFPFVYKLSPNVNQGKAKESIAAYDKAMKIWMAILGGEAITPVVWTIMSENDYPWWKQVVEEQEGKSPNYAWDPTTNMLGHCQLSSIVFCGYGNAFKPNTPEYKFLQYNVIGSNYASSPNANTVNHESVHFYQLSVVQSFPSDLPCWYIEGQASLYGGALEFNLATKRSSSIRQRDNFKSIVRQYQPNADNHATKDWVEVLKNMYQPHISCSNQQDYFKYALGMFVWEHLYEQYGPKVMHQILLDFKAGRSFDEASQMRLGLNLDQLNEELAAHLVEVFAKSPPKSTVAPTPKPRPTPTFTPKPSPTPTPERSPDELNGVICSKVNEIVRNSIGEFWCLKIGEQLRWAQNNPDPKSNPTPTSTPTPTPSSKPITQGPCSILGERSPNSLGFLECRYVKGKNLNWIQLSITPSSFQNPKSGQDVSMCKLKGYYGGNAIRGFVPDVTLMGMGNLYPRINPAVGINDAVIVPIDFPDFVGDKDLDQMINPNKEMFLAWVDYFSSGKLKTNLDSHNKWIRMPQPTSFYKLPNNVGENDLRLGQDGNIKLGQLFVDEISKQVDLTRYRTMYLLFPRNPKPGMLDVDLPPRMVEFNIQGTKRVMSLFAGIGWGYDSRVATPPWAMWVHEITHDWGLDGHAPGNGWNVGITSNQGGVSLALNSWERFLLTWMPDSQVYCDTKETLKPAKIQLSALERDDQQTKMIAIALDADRLLVIEAHGIGKWFSRRPEQDATFRLNFQDSGLYYVLAYIVNTKFVYPAQTIVNADGSALSIDDGVNRNILRHAYLEKVDGGAGSHDYPLTPTSMPGIDYAAYAAVQGDTFTVEGIKITFVSTGDYETIEISKG